MIVDMISDDVMIDYIISDDLIIADLISDDLMIFDMMSDNLMMVDLMSDDLMIVDLTIDDLSVALTGPLWWGWSLMSRTGQLVRQDKAKLTAESNPDTQPARRGDSKSCR